MIENDFRYIHYKSKKMSERGFTHSNIKDNVLCKVPVSISENGRHTNLKTFILKGSVIRKVNGIKLKNSEKKFDIEHTFSDFQRIHIPNLDFSYKDIESIDSLELQYSTNCEQICFPTYYSCDVFDVVEGDTFTLNKKECLLIKEGTKILCDQNELSEQFYKITSEEKTIVSGSVGKIAIFKIIPLNLQNEYI